MSDATPDVLREYGSIPIAFEVRSVLDCTVLRQGLGGLRLSERPLSPPYLKDYDLLEGEGPTRWADRFDLTNWGVIGVRADGVLAGGAVIALDTPGVDMLEGLRDLAVLWDLRVRPAMRGRGFGTLLFDEAARWSSERGARELKVETQNTNVPACRFYAARGCELGAIDRFAYPSLPEEVQLLWYLDLSRK